MRPLLVPLLLLVASVVDGYPLGTSLKLSGVTHSLTKGLDKLLCKAVLKEMDAEIRRHDLTKTGEGEVFDTAGQAICLGVVQNYVMYKRKGDRWSLRVKTDAEKATEDKSEVPEGIEVIGVYILKEACYNFCEVLQQEVSEAAYKAAKNGGGLEEDKFCEEVTTPPKKKKKPQQQKQKKEPSEEERYAEMIDKLGGNMDMHDMMRRDRDAPHMGLPEDQQRAVKSATSALGCPICKHAVGLVVSRSLALPRTSSGRPDEAAISQAAAAAFFTEVPEESMDYKPGNPPAWAESVTVVKEKAKGWRLRPRGEGDETEEDMDYAERIKRNVVIAQACKRAWDATDEDLGEYLALSLGRMGPSPTPEQHAELEKNVAKMFCRPVCRKHQNNHDEL